MRLSAFNNRTPWWRLFAYLGLLHRAQIIKTWLRNTNVFTPTPPEPIYFPNLSKTRHSNKSTFRQLVPMISSWPTNLFKKERINRFTQNNLTLYMNRRFIKKLSSLCSNEKRRRIPIVHLIRMRNKFNLNPINLVFSLLYAMLQLQVRVMSSKHPQNKMYI